MRTGRWNAWLLAGGLLLAGCGTDVVATATQSDQLGGAPANTPPPDEPPATDSGPTGPPATEPPDTGTAPDEPEPDQPEPDPPPPDETVPPVTDPVPTRDLQDPDPTAISFADKPARDYDALLLGAATDLDEWWTEQYPPIYGDPFTPLQGNIYAAYPGRDDMPGCGTPRTSYREVAEFVAFYCGEGDFIIYDDGRDSLLTQLARDFGPSTIGIVLAHEYGHAIQQRSGVLSRQLPTITTEQQADCFAGAWAARAFRGESPYVQFTDDDVRAGVIAMMEVRDPVGFDQLDPGGHGAGFDRVNAFQEGFIEGPARCAELIDDPLPLVPNEFQTFREAQTGGNAELSFDQDNGGLLFFLPVDLNAYWADEVGDAVGDFGGLTLEGNESAAELSCDDPNGEFEVGVALCASTGTVHLNMPIARELSEQQRTYGDFAVGYLLGYAWAEAVQQSAGSSLEGEERQLMNDCLTGAWAKTVIPVDGALPRPRAEGRTAEAQPGDMDEAIRMMIRIGDGSADEDVLGTPFEKIDAFRTGVLGGLDACQL